MGIGMVLPKKLVPFWKRKHISVFDGDHPKRNIESGPTLHRSTHRGLVRVRQTSSLKDEQSCCWNAHIVTSSAESLVTPARELAVLPIVKLASMNNLSSSVCQCAQKSQKMLVILRWNAKSDDSYNYMLLISTPEKLHPELAWFGVKMFKSWENHRRLRVVNQPQALRNYAKFIEISTYFRGHHIWNQPNTYAHFFGKKSLKTSSNMFIKFDPPQKPLHFEMDPPCFLGEGVSYMTLQIPGQTWFLLDHHHKMPMSQLQTPD